MTLKQALENAIEATYHQLDVCEDEAEEESLYQTINTLTKHKEDISV